MSDTAGMQVESSFSYKWKKVPTYGTGETLAFHKKWFLERYGFKCDDELADLIGRKTLEIADLGCGVGPNLEWFRDLFGLAAVTGVDFPEVLREAKKRIRSRRRIHYVPGSLESAPLPNGGFGFVICDNVLQHVPNLSAALATVVRIARTGALVAVNMYIRKSDLREGNDDFLRERTTMMEPDQCWAFAEAVAEFGRRLQEISPGIQDNVYYQMMKCFWRDGWSAEENALVNFDWYHPAIARRMTPEKFITAVQDARLTVERVGTTKSNINLLCRRGGSR